MFNRITITALTALITVACAADAGAAMRTTNPQMTSKSQMTMQSRVSKMQGTGSAHPMTMSGPTVMAITANPTGGKGSGTEATCDLWTNQLQQDEGAVGEATETQDKIDAVNNLNTDIDNAMDAGCFVIYAMANPQGTHIKTVSVGALATG